MKLKDIGEMGLIRRIAKGICLDNTVVKGIGDDAAVIKWKRGMYLLFASDMTLENVHFTRRSATPFEIGWKALGRNISDIAAMGGVPRYAVVSAALDPHMRVSYAQEIFRGIKTLADMFKVNIVGGDTSASERIAIDIAIIGEVEKSRLVPRDGAKEGDLILVTGSIGGSRKGKHLRFIPRVREARALVEGFKVNAMIDISDGLILDLGRVLDSSGVGARIYKSAVPVSREAKVFEKAIIEGEDFELLFTMSVAEARRFFKKGLAKMETAVTLIGEVTVRKKGFVIVDEEGRETRADAKGYLHFS